MKLQDLSIVAWQALPVDITAKLRELLWEVRGKAHLRFQLERNDNVEIPLWTPSLFSILCCTACRSPPDPTTRDLGLSFVQDLALVKWLSFLAFHSPGGKISLLSGQELWQALNLRKMWMDRFTELHCSPIPLLLCLHLLVQPNDEKFLSDILDRNDRSITWLPHGFLCNQIQRVLLPINLLYIPKLPLDDLPFPFHFSSTPSITPGKLPSVQPMEYNVTSLPMLLWYLHWIDINTILEPPLFVRDLDVVSTHLTLSHAAVGSEGPVFEAVGAVPLVCCVMPFVPELYSNLHIVNSIPSQETPRPYGAGRNTWLTLFSVKANSSFLNRYPFSTFHFFVKKSTISSVPFRNVSRFLQIESAV